MSYERFNDIRSDAVALAMSELGPERRVLDLGANDGWLSARLAGFGHRVVAVERNQRERRPVELTATGTIEWIEREISADELPTLGRFDVVIALSVLHHFPKPAEAWRNLHGMARQLAVVEIPDPREARRPAKASAWSNLRESVLATPGADVVLTLPGWGRDTSRSLVVVEIANVESEPSSADSGAHGEARSDDEGR